jgi:GrpB-like predicted nucleotidyltransferase (UPF0157 family)
MSFGKRCGVQWGVCPECVGEALLSEDGVARCLRCERVWDTGDREPCPDVTVAVAADGRGSDGRLCRSHAAAFRAQAPVFVVPYDQRWPSRFETERALLQPVLTSWLVADLEHIGSTAIPGLIAKPIIDIMAPVESLESSLAALPSLTDLQYNYFPYRADAMHWLCKPSDSYRTHHLHLVPFNSALWNERIAFRDYLRAHPAVATEYGDLKRRLAGQYRFDREAYTDAKGAFVLRVLKLALH